MDFPFGRPHHHHHHHHQSEEDPNPNPSPYAPNPYPPPADNPYGYETPPPPAQPHYGGGPPTVHHVSHEYGYRPPPPPAQPYYDGGPPTVHHVSHEYGRPDYAPPPPPPHVQHSGHEAGPGGRHGFGYGYENQEPHRPGFFPPPSAVHVEHVSHENRLGELTSQPTVGIFCKAAEEYWLSIREGSVVLVPKNPSDEYQVFIVYFLEGIAGFDQNWIFWIGYLVFLYLVVDFSSGSIFLLMNCVILTPFYFVLLVLKSLGFFLFYFKFGLASNPSATYIWLWLWFSALVQGLEVQHESEGWGGSTELCTREQSHWPGHQACHWSTSPCKFIFRLSLDKIIYCLFDLQSAVISNWGIYWLVLKSLYIMI